MSEFGITPGIEAKGRYGYFKVSRVKVYVPAPDYAEKFPGMGDGEADVELLSPRSGKDSPPIRVVGGTDDLISFFQKIINELRKDKKKGGTYSGRQ